MGVVLNWHQNSEFVISWPAFRDKYQQPYFPWKLFNPENTLTITKFSTASGKNDNISVFFFKILL